MTLFICVKQQLSNIWGLVHEKVKQQWGWAEKKLLLIKIVPANIWCRKVKHKLRVASYESKSKS